MNTKTIASISVLTVLGLIVGYAIFGKWGGEYVSLKTLFTFGSNGFERAWQSVTGIEDIRNRILLSGVAGAVIGLVLGIKLKK
jgi:hypothetical protein